MWPGVTAAVPGVGLSPELGASGVTDAGSTGAGSTGVGSSSAGLIGAASWTRFGRDSDPVTPAASAVSARALEALNPGRRATKALALVAVVAMLVAAYLAWRSRPHEVPVNTFAASAATSGTDGHDPSTTSPAASPSAMLVVAVEGKVKHPGLVRLPPGARIADAIAAAGGALPGTDLSFVNLAQKVVDGQLIVVGVAPPAGVATGSAGGTTGSAGAAGAGAPINLNSATEADLETLPGIGPALAQRIIDYRTQHGGFHSVDELRNVSGIGDAKFAEIKDLVTV
jgi:competence protein ComEA